MDIGWDTFIADAEREWKLFCWNCARRSTDRPHGWWGPFGIERAHLAAGSGRMLRARDRRAAVLLCSLCHRLHVHDTETHPATTINGVKCKTIDDANMLWLKKNFDREYWDEEFIATLWLGKVPDLVEP